MLFMDDTRCDDKICNKDCATQILENERPRDGIKWYVNSKEKNAGLLEI